MLNRTCSDDHHIFAEVHPLVILNNHLTIDPTNVFNLSENWQAHHVVSVHVEVNVFHQGLKVIVVRRMQFLEDGIFLHFNVIMVIL